MILNMMICGYINQFEMITKIISGAQTGADQGALDAAIKLGVPYGGWIPKGRLTEDGPLPDKYQLIEMFNKSYPARTEKNILESDGTLILSHTKLTGGSRLTEKLVNKHGKPCLHINLDGRLLKDAAAEAHTWVEGNDIEVLNVAGSRSSKDPLIYRDTLYIVESILYLGKIGAPAGASIEDYTHEQLVNAFLVPKSVDEAVDVLLQRLTQDARNQISDFDEDDLPILSMKIGTYIRNEFKLWSDNDELLFDCCRIAGVDGIHPDSASGLIIRKLWEFLRQERH